MEGRRKGTLIVVCGLPGSGKTTHARALAAERGIRMSADDWMGALGINLWDEERRARVEGLQWQLTQELLALGQTVVIEWGSWGRSERDVLREGAHALGATVELHYLTAPVDVLWQRVRRRRLEDPPATRADVERWARQIQAPTPEELALFDDARVIEQR